MRPAPYPALTALGGLQPRRWDRIPPTCHATQRQRGEGKRGFKAKKICRPRASNTHARTHTAPSTDCNLYSSCGGIAAASDWLRRGKPRWNPPPLPGIVSSTDCSARPHTPDACPSSTGWCQRPSHRPPATNVPWVLLKPHEMTETSGRSAAMKACRVIGGPMHG